MHINNILLIVHGAYLAYKAYGSTRFKRDIMIVLEKLLFGGPTIQQAELLHPYKVPSKGSRMIAVRPQ